MKQYVCSGKTYFVVYLDQELFKSIQVPTERSKTSLTILLVVGRIFPVVEELNPWKNEKYSNWRLILVICSSSSSASSSVWSAWINRIVTSSATIVVASWGPKSTRYCGTVHPPITCFFGSEKMKRYGVIGKLWNDAANYGDLL